MTEIAHFIDGKAVAGASGRSQPVYNPATGSSERSVPLASPAEVDAAAWDGLLAQQAQPTPFMRHAYLLALETSGSATAKTGWRTRHRCRCGGASRASSTTC